MIEYWVTNCFEFETGIRSTLAPSLRSIDIHNGLELSQHPSLFHPGSSPEVSGHPQWFGTTHLSSHQFISTR